MHSWMMLPSIAVATFCLTVCWLMEDALPLENGKQGACDVRSKKGCDGVRVEGTPVAEASNPGHIVAAVVHFMIVPAVSATSFPGA